MDRTEKIKITVIAIAILAVLIIPNIAFLPGPSILCGLSQTLYNGCQFLSFPALITATPIGIIYFFVRKRKKKSEVAPGISVTCSLLILLPIVSLFSWLIMANIMRDFSRTYIINRTEKLINGIENYKNQKDEYPEKLEQLVPEYIDKIPSPGIIGVPQFIYRRGDDSYNLAFNQNVILSFNIEVVIYDPNDNHVVWSEVQTLYETGKEHWKYFILD